MTLSIHLETCLNITSCLSNQPPSSNGTLQMDNIHLLLLIHNSLNHRTAVDLDLPRLCFFHIEYSTPSALSNSMRGLSNSHTLPLSSTMMRSESITVLSRCAIVSTVHSLKPERIALCT